MTAARDFASARDRPAPLRMRPDLQVFSQSAEGRPVWVIKDPVALEYRRLDAEEFAILSMLDGRTTPRDIQQSFEKRFAPHRLSFPQLEAFLARLHREGLAISDLPGQGERLFERAARRRRNRLAQVWTNPLAIRFRGVDPDRVLNFLAPYCGWLFSPIAVAGGLLLVLAAAAVLTGRWDEAIARLPQMDEVLRAKNLGLLVVTIALTKTLHELGHALACKRFGGECHELGVMLLVFTPCLYCDVSDSWTFPSRRRRAAVAAAGVYVELVLAALAGFGWWFSREGTFHSLCLLVLVVCSVGAIVFNANPLLRYDGYYLLSDALGVANLRQRSAAIVRGALARWCLGWRQRHDRFLPARRRWLAAYAVASTLYTWMVVAAILWWLHLALAPHGLSAIAALLAAVVVGRMLYEPVTMAARVIQSPVQRRRIHKGRLAATLVLLAGAVLAVGWIRAPQRVSAPAVLIPSDAQYVFVTAPGVVTEAAAPGDNVEAGETIGRLTDHAVETEIVELESQRNHLRRKLEHLEAMRHDAAPSVAAEASASLPSVKESLADVESRIAQRRSAARRLVLTASHAGTVIPPPRRNESGRNVGLLPSWTGTPLDERNLGCFLETGTLFCVVGDPARVEVIAAIPTHEAGLIQSGQRVRIKLDALPHQVLKGHVDQVARSSQFPSEDLSRGTLWIPQESIRPNETPTHYARIRLDAPPLGAAIGAQGTAKIVVAPQSLGERLTRWAARTFRFSS